MNKLIAALAIAALPTIASAQSQLGNSTGTQASATPSDPGTSAPNMSPSDDGHSKRHGMQRHGGGSHSRKGTPAGTNPKEATGPH